MLAPCCDDVAVHSHDGGKTLRKAGQPYAYRYAFAWRWPKALIVHPAIRRAFSVQLNRYPGVVIGISVQIGRRALSVLWGRPGRIVQIH